MLIIYKITHYSGEFPFLFLMTNRNIDFNISLAGLCPTVTFCLLPSATGFWMKGLVVGKYQYQMMGLPSIPLPSALSLLLQREVRGEGNVRKTAQCIGAALPLSLNHLPSDDLYIKVVSAVSLILRY